MILTGGTSRRMGRDKASLQFGDQTVLDFILHFVPSGIPTVIVGEETSHAAIHVRENPPGGGPVAGIESALSQIFTKYLYVIAVDTPFGLPWLLEQNPQPSVQAVIPRDSQGRPHYLCAIYETDALRHAMADLGASANASMRDMIANISTVEYVDAPCTSALTTHEILLDVNTPEDLETAQAIRNRIWPD